jgi:ribosomal protein L3 glutamine methyltransferase
MAADDAARRISKELRTLRDCVRWGASEFSRARLAFGHGTDNALDEAFHLVLWALKLPLDLPAVYLEARLTEQERREAVSLLLERVRSRKPAAYLTGQAWFAGLAFEVDERVLVPRSPIAELIEARFAPWLAAEPESILDLCAGSGCIGIACAHAFPEARVDLAEIDPGALALIDRNLARHHLGRKVQAVAGDLFAPLKDRRYDLIVSNPPYVPTLEWQELAPEYKHEPRLALDAGADGMDVVARILRAAPRHLTPDGTLVCEIGGSQEEFDARFPRLPVSWPEFERGGDGVFVISRAELAAWQTAQRKKQKAKARA